jgi:NAD(P)-dependent dehydrogenase (short-subunit alcohol dehydrogenase family)
MTAPIVVFGGAGGMGEAIAHALYQQERPIHLVGRDRARIEAVSAQLGGAAFSIANVENEGDISRAITEAVDHAGGTLAGLCYAVGTINLKPMTRLMTSDIETDFRVNALGAFHAVKAAVPAMKAYEGTASVLLFSTIAVHQGFSSHVSVAMAKGAVEGLVFSLATELAPKIRVNAIAPSLTKTPLASALLANEAMAQAIAGLHPLQRLGDASDIAPLARLLLTEEGSWITGQVIGIDGGRSTLRTKG